MSKPELSYKVGVVGIGVVGGALVHWLENYTSHKIYKVDPKKGLNDSLDDVNIVFISVPVPCKDFKQDLKILESAIKSVPKGKTIIIRSTVLPGTCGQLSKKYDRKIAHIPEFLTARRANDDMVKCKFIYLGAENSITQDLVLLIQDIFPNKGILPMGTQEAEMLKYAHNLHGAFKVTFWNCIEDLCRKNNANYDIVRIAAINATGFINAEHTHVPGPDKKRGFGGTCFPVNLENFIGFTQEQSPLFHALLMNVYSINQILRGGKNGDEASL